jgi:hypothetical protein
MGEHCRRAFLQTFISENQKSTQTYSPVRFVSNFTILTILIISHIIVIVKGIKRASKGHFK